MDLGSSQFSILPFLPLKMMLGLKVFKSDLKITISLHQSKSVSKFNLNFELPFFTTQHTTGFINHLKVNLASAIIDLAWF